VKKTRNIWVFLALLIVVLAILFSRFYVFSHVKKKETENDWTLQLEEALEEQKQDRIEQEKAEQGEEEQEGEEQGKMESEQGEESAGKLLENIDVQKKENGTVIEKSSSDLQKENEISSPQKSEDVQKKPQPNSSTGNTQFDFEAAISKIDSQMDSLEQDIQEEIDSKINKTLGTTQK